MAVLLPAVREHAFATSGRTGEPVVWLRTEEQVRQEIRLLADVLVGAVDRVVNFAPPRHLYGFLFGRRLPAELGVPVEHLWDSPLAPPSLSTRDRTLFVCVPSSWIVLRGMADRLGALPSAVAIHGTGPVTAAARHVVDALGHRDFRASEIFGSTETGAIAHRSLASPDPWELFEDVTLVAEPGAAAARRLRVASGRVGRRHDMPRPPESLTLEDTVCPVGDRHFTLVGRATGLIKVNGRRFRLESVESSLSAAFPHLDMVCVPVEDDVRAEHYELFCGGVAADVPLRDIHAHLAATLPGLPVPRAVHRVAAIPRTANGKVQVHRLLAMAGSPPADGAGR